MTKLRKEYALITMRYFTLTIMVIVFRTWLFTVDRKLAWLICSFIEEIKKLSLDLSLGPALIVQWNCWVLLLPISVSYFLYRLWWLSWHYFTCEFSLRGTLLINSLQHSNQIEIHSMPYYYLGPNQKLFSFPFHQLRIGTKSRRCLTNTKILSQLHLCIMEHRCIAI